MGSIDLSIVIVNYKTPQLTHDCVASIHEFTQGLSFEVIVVDNQSEDESKDVILGAFPNTVWVDNGDNAGTSRGYNAGVRNSKGAYVLILNSDTVIKSNVFKESMDAYQALEEKGKVGMYSCQLKGFDNEIQFNSNISFPTLRKFVQANPFFIKFIKPQKIRLSFEEKMELHQRDHEACWIGIAFGLINAKIFKEEQLYFDEDIFMYSDEVEWCLRLNKLGYKHYFSAQHCIFHINSGSSTSFSGWRAGQITLSEWLYFMKIEGKMKFTFMTLLILFNHFLDSLFTLKSKVLGKTPESEKSARETRKMELELIRKYFFKILFNYKKTPSTANTYLKYE
jgi:GT2 family glycosyltransferase